jgi:general stress protein YciG
MSDNSPDPKLMRGQQDKDTPQHIALDETQRPSGRSDSDAESRRERESANAGQAPNDKEQMASILEQNGGTQGDTAVKPDEAATAGETGGGLARKGRSLLDD